MEHPFYTAEEEWVNAGDLSLGEEILALDGSIGVVEGVEVVTHSQPMYNLTVADAHTFFVGDGQWLVHNTDCDLFATEKSLGGSNSPFKQHNSLSGRCDTCADEAGRIIKNAYPEYDVDIIRIQNERVFGGSRGANMRVRNKNNQLFDIASDPKMKQPFHDVVRIQNGGKTYVMDSLIAERQGLRPMTLGDYFKLWEYPDGVEITGHRSVP